MARIDKHADDPHFFKAIPIEKLREILNRVPGGWYVTANRMSNIAFLDEDQSYKGFVDLLTEEHHAE